MVAREKLRSLLGEEMFREITHVVSISSREHSINESSLISNSFEPMSPAPNQKRERGRMACANEFNDEIYTHQSLGQVTQVERDEHQLAVDSQDSNNTVVKLLSKGRRNNEEGAQPRSLRAMRSTKLSLERPIILDLTKKRSISILSLLEEVREEDLSVGQDDPCLN